MRHKVVAGAVAGAILLGVSIAALLMSSHGNNTTRLNTAGAGATSGSSTAPGDNRRVWLLPGQPPKQQSAQTNPAVTLPGPQMTHINGTDSSVALAKELGATPALTGLAPSSTFSVGTGSSQQAEVDFPNGLSVIRQQLSAPIYMQEITFGSPQDTYEQLPNGYEVLTINHSRSFSEVVFVSSSGVMTILISTLNASTQTPPAYTPSQLRSLATQLIAKG